MQASLLGLLLCAEAFYFQGIHSDRFSSGRHAVSPVVPAGQSVLTQITARHSGISSASSLLCAPTGKRTTHSAYKLCWDYDRWMLKRLNSDLEQALRRAACVPHLSRGHPPNPMRFQSACLVSPLPGFISQVQQNAQIISQKFHTS